MYLYIWSLYKLYEYTMCMFYCTRYDLDLSTYWSTNIHFVSSCTHFVVDLCMYLSNCTFTYIFTLKVRIWQLVCMYIHEFVSVYPWKRIDPSFVGFGGRNHLDAPGLAGAVGAAPRHRKLPVHPPNRSDAAETQLIWCRVVIFTNLYVVFWCLPMMCI